MRNKKGQFIHNKFTNWRIWAISSTLLFCLIAANYGNQDKVYVAEQPKVEAFLVPIIVEPEETIEEKFKRHFPRSYKTMLAIAKAESGMKMESKGYNCFYNDDMTIVYKERVKGSHSAACKPSHRNFAHSVDCFILQDNQPKSRECPKDVTVDQHLEEMAELSRICGLDCWWAYKNGSYKKYLANN